MHPFATVKSRRLQMFAIVYAILWENNWLILISNFSYHRILSWVIEALSNNPLYLSNF